MASFLERYEREIKRINKKDWVTYQWEELLLDPAKKNLLQRGGVGANYNGLDISQFKNDEGQRLGRNILYRDGRFRAWTGYRERLKPFYIYKNKVMVWWKPNWNSKTKGNWNIGVYMKPNFATKHRNRIKRALDLDLMLREQWNNFQGMPSGIYSNNLNALEWPDLANNTKVIEGGSIRNENGRSQLVPTEWNDMGELKNLKSAKQLAENIWKLAAINESYLRWMDDESIDVSTLNTPLIGLDIYPYGRENQQDSSPWWDYTPFTRLSDWSDMITRPRTAYIINWTNFAPDV